MRLRERKGRGLRILQEYLEKGILDFEPDLKRDVSEIS